MDGLVESGQRQTGDGKRCAKPGKRCPGFDDTVWRNAEHVALAIDRADEAVRRRPGCAPGAIETGVRLPEQHNLRTSHRSTRVSRARIDRDERGRSFHERKQSGDR